MTTTHSAMTGAELHEPKGVAGASDDAIANAASGAVQWTAGYLIPKVKLSETVWSNTNQTTAATTEVVEFQLSHTGTGTYFDTATNYAFTAPSGVNRVSFVANIKTGGTLTAGTYFEVYGEDSVGTPLSKPFPQQVLGAANKPMSLTSGPISCTAGDQFYLRIISAATGEVIPSGSSFSAYFWKD